MDGRGERKEEGRSGERGSSRMMGEDEGSREEGRKETTGKEAGGNKSLWRETSWKGKMKEGRERDTEIQTRRKDGRRGHMRDS